MNLEEAVLPVATDTNPLTPELEDPTEKYRILHQHVLDFQAGKPGAAEAILESFDKFLYRYYNFIVYGGGCLKSSSLRRFIALFTTSLSQKKVKKYRYSRYVQNRLVDSEESVRKLLSCYDSEDVMQYLKLALLEMALRYHDYSRPSFHTYVEKNYHFYAARAFPSKDALYHSTLSNDVEMLCGEELLKQNLYEYERFEQQLDHELLVENSQEFVINEEGISVFEDEALNLNWINGVTCSDKFKCLTPFERKLMILSYHYNLQDDDIANEYGFCRATINRKKITAVKKLLEVI